MQKRIVNVKIDHTYSKEPAAILPEAKTQRKKSSLGSVRIRFDLARKNADDAAE